ncbi:unnamed protein product [Chrysoparadoxa australica]
MAAPAMGTVSFADQGIHNAQLSQELAELAHSKQRYASRPARQQEVGNKGAKLDASGLKVFEVTFRRTLRTDLMAADAKAEREAAHPAARATSAAEARSPGSGTAGAKQLGRVKPSFVLAMPRSATKQDLECSAAKLQADMREVRRETVPATALENFISKKWGLEPEAAFWSNGERKKPWVTAVGHTNSKAANLELVLQQARDTAGDGRGPEPRKHSFRDEAKTATGWTKYFPVLSNDKALATGRPVTLLNHITQDEWERVQRERSEKRAYICSILSQTQPRIKRKSTSHKTWSLAGTAPADEQVATARMNVAPSPFPQQGHTRRGEAAAGSKEDVQVIEPSITSSLQIYEVPFNHLPETSTVTKNCVGTRQRTPPAETSTSSLPSHSCEPFCNRLRALSPSHLKDMPLTR